MMFQQPRCLQGSFNRHSSSSSSNAVPPALRRSLMLPAIAGNRPPAATSSQQLVEQQLCYMPEPWSRHASSQPASTPLGLALPSPHHTWLALAACCAIWVLRWAKAGAASTHTDQLPTTPLPPSDTPHVSPAMRWASLQLQDTTDPLLPSTQPQGDSAPISQLICCIRTPPPPPSTLGLHTSSPSASTTAEAIRHAVRRLSGAPAAPPITGLLVTYPACALLVLEGDTSSLCAALREVMQPAAASPASSLVPPGLPPLGARAVSFNPEANTRQFNDWFEASVSTPLGIGSPSLALNRRSLAQRGTQPGGSVSGLGMPGMGGGMPGMGGGMPGMGGGMPGMGGGMPGMGGGMPGTDGGMPGTGGDVPMVKSVLSDSEFLEAAEAVALFVSLLSAKLQGLPGFSQREQLLKELALRMPSVPEQRVVANLAATEAVPTLREFLARFDVEYERYAALVASDGGRQLLEAAVAEAHDDDAEGGGGPPELRPAAHPGAAAPEDPTALDLRRLHFLYHRHLALQLQLEAAAASPFKQTPLAKHYPKK